MFLLSRHVAQIEIENIHKKYGVNVVKTTELYQLLKVMDGEDALKIANKKHDLIALHIYDKREQELPNIGLIKLMDAETGDLKWLDTSDKKVRTHFAASALKQNAILKETFNKCGVDTARINTAESYIVPLTNLFKRR